MNHSTFHAARALLVVAAASLPLLPARLPAQDGGPGTGGLVRLAQERRALASPYRVLVVGAHPDDEDNTLIATLSRGWGVEVGYLSLTRGEGGQNLIGGELGAALGVVRASELVAARAVDGGRQFFTRAFDFGYTRSVEETWAFWPRDSLLKDVVRVIRRFRPHVIVAVFSGTPRDGHGQHQASGILALDGFRAAGDPTRFPELGGEEGLGPWTPSKLYRDYGVQEGITLDAGVLDPATGHSLHQIGRRSRSQHRSQDMGQLEEPGPASVTLGLEAVAAGVEAGPMDSLFHGITAAEDPHDRQHAATARLVEAGVVLDAYVEDDEVVPGQELPLHLVAWNGGHDTVNVAFSLYPTAGWSPPAADSSCLDASVRLAPGAVHRCHAPLRVAPDAFPDQPYYLIAPVDGAMYRWRGHRAEWGEPFDRPLQVLARVASGGAAPLTATLTVTARQLDQGLGEVRDPVTIVPRVLLDLAPGRFLWPRGVRSRAFTLTVEHAARDTTVTTVRLVAPEGWQVDSARVVRFTREGERRTLRFTVQAPARPADGEVTFLAEAAIGGDTLRLGARRIDYPHLRERVVFHLADATATVAPVTFPRDLAIGYVRGAADAIPEALDAAGVGYRLLAAADLEGAVLDSLDVVVVGPRAYEIDDALRRAHPRLLRFAERGGTLIIQYQQYQFIEGGFAPLPMTIARPHDRIADETAPIRFLEAGAALAATPNRLTVADFEGWVQERGLYFAHEWDPRWTPLVESRDPGQPPQRGGLLVGRLGRGTVVYTGIAFFRQLPAAVPGAWRLFANLLAIGR